MPGVVRSNILSSKRQTSATIEYISAKMASYNRSTQMKLALNEEDQDPKIWSDYSLKARIQELKKSEAIESTLEATQNRKAIDDSSIFGKPENTKLSEEVMIKKSLITLPVVCMDALLPMQHMEARTEDPTFCRFLRDLGLGGWFVMTSLDPSTRKIRRHGVLVKIVASDALRPDEEFEEEAKATSLVDSLVMSPTAVDFELVGHTRCRILGPTESMKRRIGRWRRGYDPNGEEVQLGWGEERFLDAMISPSLDDSSSPENIDKASDGASSTTTTTGSPAYTEWSSIPVQINLEMIEAMEKEEDEDLAAILAGVPTSSAIEKVKELNALVDEWYQLARDPSTFENVNVTATTRIRVGHPGLWISPETLLRRVSNQLGPRPCSWFASTDVASSSPTAAPVTSPTVADITAFIFWAAALINPLPPLGVSLEIRGRLLEAPTLRRRLEILELGLRRSIDNLKGTRPLI